jgi:hypothetical protein
LTSPVDWATAIGIKEMHEVTTAQYGMKAQGEEGEVAAVKLQAKTTPCAEKGQLRGTKHCTQLRSNNKNLWFFFWPFWVQGVRCQGLKGIEALTAGGEILACVGETEDGESEELTEWLELLQPDQQ